MVFLPNEPFLPLVNGPDTLGSLWFSRPSGRTQCGIRWLDSFFILPRQTVMIAVRFLFSLGRYLGASVVISGPLPISRLGCRCS
jgi:hypothetical protein